MDTSRGIFLVDSSKSARSGGAAEVVVLRYGVLNDGLQTDGQRDVFLLLIVNECWTCACGAVCAVTESATTVSYRTLLYFPKTTEL